MAGVEIRKRVIGGPEPRGKVQGNISTFTVYVHLPAFELLLCFLLYSEPLTVLISSVAFVGVVIVLHIVSKFFH